MIRSIVISIAVFGLVGCVLSAKPKATSLGGLVKPTTKQLQANSTDIVCRSMRYITFSKDKDSPETKLQIRQHNSALLSFGCVAKK